MELWEGSVDKVERGNSYHFKNIKTKVFDDVKYVNTNNYTSIDMLNDLEITDFEIPQIKENIIQGKIVGVDMTKTRCCQAS